MVVIVLPRVGGFHSGSAFKMRERCYSKLMLAGPWGLPFCMRDARRATRSPRAHPGHHRPCNCLTASLKARSRSRAVAVCVSLLTTITPSFSGVSSCRHRRPRARSPATRSPSRGPARGPDSSSPSSAEVRSLHARNGGGGTENSSRDLCSERRSLGVRTGATVTAHRVTTSRQGCHLADRASRSPRARRSVRSTDP